MNELKRRFGRPENMVIAYLKRLGNWVRPSTDRPESFILLRAGIDIPTSWFPFRPRVVSGLSTGP